MTGQIVSTLPPRTPPTDNVPRWAGEIEQSAPASADEAHPTQARSRSARRFSRRGLELLIGAVVLAVLGAAAWGVFRWTSDAMYRPVDNRELDRFKKHQGGVYCLTPHLNYFSEVKAYAVWPDPELIAQITPLTVGGRLLYAVAYSAVMLCCSILVFRRRSF